jgi:hypothetical protein
VLIKNLKLLTGMLLLLSLSIVSASPAKAALTEEQLQHHQSDHPGNTEKDAHLLSQLPGHDLYDGGEQISPTEYKIGRVVGKTGNILFIVLQDGTGTYFRTSGSANPGADVLVGESDGVYYIVGTDTLPYMNSVGGMDTAHPMWISRLELKEVPQSGSLSSRTAPLWQQLEASMSRTAVEMPPPQPAPAYSAPASTYEGEPVRALW